ncbi:protein kinase pkn/prk1: effector-like protein [Dinothrombium tinctorium]|uniref:Protein kinase pkn/prk1: effector-like protein n=1 Tax=Dinothrombium tinctorium TaxID=1965070 RepID=A0A3S3PJW8_9ACAR|nr:protein kinase pkn/prk1: effector-like protein [Dinothrombium tinctorium]RWS13979.1 protein kinase pkn/prk1: effector-like protein [Dinothrombium tinctorium]RWS16357.1 protein kinase pkn/prk1: effector-like protein [Dinothrombium tinctorium]
MSISSAQGKLYELEKQYKAAERYLKRLEFQLAKVEELKDQYELHLKMRDGVRSMAYAYVLSSGKDRDSALSSVRSGFRECTDTLCAIESELESIMGTLLLQMKGIQGFARLCPGDVFEVTIKHGDNQKWKTKGRVLKNGNQTWDSQQVLFKALLGDILSIKAVEVRGLGKNVALGNKFCETKDLFSAHPQLMTINLNAIGTLKLNLVVTWNPLHCSPNDLISHKQYHSTSSSSLLGIGSSRTLPTILTASPGVSKRRFIGTLPQQRMSELDDDYYHNRLSESNRKEGSNAATPTSTSTSSGSTGSSLHLTGTSGFGSGSSSSYCESSVPNSALTSPETEIAPTLQKNRPLSASITNICPKHGGERSWNAESSNREPKSKEVVVEVTVHQNPTSQANDDCEERRPSSRHNDEYNSSPTFYELRRNEGKNGMISAESAANLYFNISDTLINLMTSLEDIQGQYSELHILQQQILELYRVLKQVNKIRGLCNEKKGHNQKTRVRRNSGTSEISMSVESALECFDFLNNAITDSDPDSSPEHEKYIQNNRRTPDTMNNSRFASINPRGLNERSQFSSGNLSSNNSTPSPISSPQPLSTGSEQLDVALMAHLTYCQRLLENLGSFGPLRRRELISLDKLQVQATAIKILEKLCFNLYEYLQKRQETNDQNLISMSEEEYHRKQEKELSYLKVDQRIRKLWDTVCYQHSQSSDEIGSTLIYVTSGQFSQSLETYMKAFLTPMTTSNNNSPASIFTKVAKLITSRLIDASKFESDCVVTIFQVGIFFSQENSSLEHLFKSFADEVSLLDSLQSGDAIEVKQALNKFKKTLPPKEPLFNIALLLLDRDPLIARIAETFFLESNRNRSMRSGLIVQFLEGLEVDYASLRQASCLALMLLNATEVMDELVYISYADTSSAVREQAKSTLFSFGDIGRKLYEESQLFAHGFQGLSVK